jgi:EpsD family peptidyl-prolyl cis-trans isomerase
LHRSSVSPLIGSQSESTPRLGLTRSLVAAVQVCALLLGMAACKPGGPSGQVVATVNGKEITSQDLAAEARATGNSRRSAPALLQEVIARNLLAQSAHDQKLDAYPGYPSDLVRIQQAFLADKALGKVLRPAGPPTAAAIAAFEAAHPYQFAQRSKVQVDEVRFETADNLKSMEGISDLAGVVAKLKSINAPFDRKSQTLDTAQMPDQLAERLLAAPLGQLQVFRDGNVVLGVVVLGRDPVIGPPEQEAAEASGVMAKLAVQSQVGAEVARLRAKATIAYQKGYAPPVAAASALAPRG